MRDESGVPSATSFRSGIVHHLCRYYHAHRLLEMICALQSARHNAESPRSRQPQLLYPTPFAGYAILLAIVTLSTSEPAITLVQIWGGMLGGLAFVRELEPLWSPGLRQSRAGEQHLLQHVSHGPSLAYHPPLTVKIYGSYDQP
jgi:hypothetical protein